MTNILLIDDSKSVHNLVKEWLPFSVCALSSAFHGKEGFETLCAKPNHFDLVLLDWEMPIQDGPTTIKSIRKMFISLPVIMMTSRNSVADITSMLREGANEYIMKPFTKDILFSKIGSVLPELFSSGSVSDVG